MRRATLCLAALCALLCAADAWPAMIYVAPDGDDAAAGTLQQPFATIERAKAEVRSIKAAGLTEPVTVVLREGTYRITEPVVFGPEDSGTAECPITYCAAPGEHPVISGGRVIKGRTRDVSGRFVAEIPEAAGGEWVFRQLFVNGKRRILARSPNEGYYYMASKAPPATDPATGQEIDRSQTAFVFHPGEVRNWPDLAQADLVVYHIWETAILPIASVDEADHVVTFTGPSKWAFGWAGRQRFVVENVGAAFDAPGEWLLFRRAGTLSILPLPGEDLTKAEIIAPVATQLVRLDGDPDNGRHVENIRFDGLSFQHAEWPLPPEGHGDWQAAVTVDAAIQARGARNCAIERCEVAHVGGYAIWFERGCIDNKTTGCHLHDLGAGGVRIGEAAIPQVEGAVTGRNVVESNFIHDGGHVHAGAIGIWVGQSSDNVLAHNEICDMNYTGISVGWSWGYSPTTCHRNTIEFNHLHHLGQNVLSDMGAIYTLGISTGTVVRNNLIHDICGYEYSGAAGIYPDEGSSGILYENNVVYRTVSGGFSIHYGQELTARNNIFAFGRDYEVSRGRIDKETNFTFDHNIVYYDGETLYTGSGKITANDNVYFNTGGEDVAFPDDLTLAEWQATGQDARSVVADPLFVDPKADDFRLRAGSPALALGFQPIDTSQCGLTEPASLVALADAVRTPPLSIGQRPPMKPQLIDDGFEDSAVGTTAESAVTWGETGEAKVRVTDEAAAEGKHSLQFTDAPGLDYPFNPHIWYTPNLERGLVTVSYDLRIEKGALVGVEWRDAASPYRVGPSLSINANEQLVVAGKPVMDMPVSQWVHFVTTCRIGRDAPGKWDLEVTAPGAEPLRLTGLACDPKCRRFQWLGFISNATERTVFYLDNVRITVRP